MIEIDKAKLSKDLANNVFENIYNEHTSFTPDKFLELYTKQYASFYEDRKQATTAKDSARELLNDGYLKHVNGMISRTDKLTVLVYVLDQKTNRI